MERTLAPPTQSHLSHRSNWLRAAVLGANDGIVSTASLVLGVAASGASGSAVMTAGVAGLAAGALSMAAGEYVSVSSQRDSEEADLRLEQRELEHDPHGELRELSAIYEARGLSAGLARQVAVELTEAGALQAHARDELGLEDKRRARPLQAAWTSALAFSIGARPAAARDRPRTRVGARRHVCRRDAHRPGAARRHGCSPGRGAARAGHGARPRVGRCGDVRDGRHRRPGGPGHGVKLTIRPLESAEDAAAFRALNEEWIARHFVVEEQDRRQLEDPVAAYITPGGQILIAESGGRRVGCVALVPDGTGAYELSKMAVAPELRGQGGVAGCSWRRSTTPVGPARARSSSAARRSS